MSEISTSERDLSPADLNSHFPSIPLSHLTSRKHAAPMPKRHPDFLQKSYCNNNAQQSRRFGRPVPPYHHNHHHRHHSQSIAGGVQDHHVTRNYDSGFGSNNLSASVGGCSGYSSSLSSSVSNLPPPPPYTSNNNSSCVAAASSIVAGTSHARGVRCGGGGTGRSFRIHRSYSDSRYAGGGLTGNARMLSFPYARHCHSSCRSSWYSRSPSPSMSTVSCPEYGDLQDKLHRLESDRESLSLQVSVLNEQVGAQTEKIKDLESLLDDKLHRLDSTEEMLQEEFDTRTTLETDRVDLLSEISTLKLKLIAIQREKYDSEQKMSQAQDEIEKLQKLFRSRQEVFPLIREFNEEVKELRNGSNNYKVELEELRNAVHQLALENEEKDQKIAELKAMVGGHYLQTGSSEPIASRSNINCIRDDRQLQNFQIYDPNSMDLNSQLRQLLAEDFSDSLFEKRLPVSNSYPLSFDVSRVLSHPYSCQSTLSNLLNDPPVIPTSKHGLCYQSVVSSELSVPQEAWISSNVSPSSSSGCQTQLSSYSPSKASEQISRSPLPSTLVSCVDSGIKNRAHHSREASTSSSAAVQAILLSDELKRLAPAYSSCRTLKTSQVIPQPRISLPSKTIINIHKPPVCPKMSTSVSLSLANESHQSRNNQSKGLRWIKDHFRSSKRSTSAPNLNRSNIKAEQCSASESGDDASTSAKKMSPNKSNNRRSVKRFISKFRLNTSRNDEAKNEKFPAFQSKRHSNPNQITRLRFSSDRQTPLRPPMNEFNQWNGEMLALWMSELGLNIYASDCCKNLKSGRHLISLSSCELEKEINMRNALHKKKLLLALRAIEFNKEEPSDSMDYHQVLRWLDDIGLPQFRDTFAENRIDGSVLNMLTIEDLLNMKITSALHHASLSRGIEILRLVDFNLNRLQRKFNSDVLGKGPIPNAVQYWTQHFVSEWLRTIDLSEFTPNLMCAGVHGALMILEPSFTADTLASVLSISSQKSLIRRHLSMHFNDLLGPEVISRKREHLSRPGIFELNTSMKVKPYKKGGSSAASTLSRRRSKSDVFLDPDNLVCPLIPSRRVSSVSCGNTPFVKESISEQFLSRLESSNV